MMDGGAPAIFARAASRHRLRRALTQPPAFLDAPKRLEAPSAGEAGRAEDYLPLPPWLLPLELAPLPEDPEPLPEPVDPDEPLDPLVSLLEPIEPVEPLDPVEPVPLDPVELPMLEPLPEEPEPEVSEPDVPGEDDPEADDESELPEPGVLELPEDGRDVLPLRPCDLDLLRVEDPVVPVSVEEEEVSDPWDAVSDDDPDDDPVPAVD
jgi:hypothetical protein